METGVLLRRAASASWLVAGTLLAIASCASCTPSENQLFTPPKLVSVPVDGSAGGPTDAGKAWGDAGLVYFEAEDGGAAPRTRELDPDASFVWTETPPGKGTCDPGRFAGQFSCDFQGRGGLGRVQGSISFMLSSGVQLQTLDVTQAQLIGFGDGPSALWTSSLAGQLSCGSSAFSASCAAAPGSPWSPPKGKLQGTFDGEALTITGTITLTADSGAQCQGSWSVAR
ncbi:MAG TPA: hypothetical protein VF331_07610 [Polyangiales bacterium]